MNSPISDFVNEYAKKKTVRFHMPGHKGKVETDITEIDGADELFSPTGIIAESEKNASEIFGAHTFYSCGGSTLCAQATVMLLALYGKKIGKNNIILACRNAHRSFVNAVAMVGADVEWLYPKSGGYMCCLIEKEEIEAEIKRCNPVAVYITSPDYLGNIADIKGISEVCKKHGVLLAVDCAHGAYLRFFSQYPTDLGADICFSSAHKTLPVLTGGAYLHISHSAPDFIKENAKNATSVFASTSPSYLILQSLDKFNSVAEEFAKSVRELKKISDDIKKQIEDFGFGLAGDEVCKITLLPKKKGYTGEEIAQKLKDSNIYPEFYDPDTVVLMISPENNAEDFDLLIKTLKKIETRSEIISQPPGVYRGEKVLTLREAVFSESETVPTDKALGRVCADTALQCPPAIPVVTCGERISKEHIRALTYYGKREIRTVTECKKNTLT